MFETRSNSRFCNMVSVGPQPRLRRGRAQSPAPVPSTTPDTKRGLPRVPGHRRSAPLVSSASPPTCSRHDRRPTSKSRRRGRSPRNAPWRARPSSVGSTPADASRPGARPAVAGRGSPCGAAWPTETPRRVGLKTAAVLLAPTGGREVDPGGAWRQHRTSRCTVAGASATVGMVLSRAGDGV
jgi:hypothetical protein